MVCVCACGPSLVRNGAKAGTAIFLAARPNAVTPKTYQLKLTNKAAQREEDDDVVDIILVACFAFFISFAQSVCRRSVVATTRGCTQPPPPQPPASQPAIQLLTVRPLSCRSHGLAPGLQFLHPSLVTPKHQSSNTHRPCRCAVQTLYRQSLARRSPARR